MEALIRLQDGTCPEVEANPLRGYIVALKPDGHSWGICEGLPEYGVIIVPGVDPAGQVDRERPWRMRADMAVTLSDIANDAHAITIAATAFNARTGEGKVVLSSLTKNKIDRFLTSWGATGIATADNAVSFNVRIADAYRSRGFWNADLDGLVFSEVSYDQATGVHRVRIDYSGTTWTAAERDSFRALAEELTTFVSINTTTRRITVDIRRSVVRDRFIEEIRQRVNNIIIRRRRYRLSEAACQQIEAAGGGLVIQPSDLSAAIIDYLTE